MQRLEVSGAVLPIYGSLGVKRLMVVTYLDSDGLKMSSICSFALKFPNKVFMRYLEGN